MKKFENILLIRAGNIYKSEIRHPVHYPAPLSLKYAQTVLENNGSYNVHMIDYWVDPVSMETLIKKVDELSIDAVVVSISSPAAEAGWSICRELKAKKDIFTVIVGSDVSEKHEYYLSLEDLFDVLIRGEYELELSSLFDQLNSAEDLQTVIEYYNQQKSKELLKIEDLDALPYLNWERDEIDKYPYIYPVRYNKRILSGYISTSRGCPHACTFCSPTIRKSFGTRLRLRSPERIGEDIERLTKQGVNVVSFEDDDFTLNKEHVTAVCNEILKRKLDIRWGCHARVDEVEPEILAIMKKAGCALLLFGIESGSQRVVNVLHKASAKSGWDQRAQQAIQDVRRAKISSCAMFIVGCPSETLEDVEDSIKLAQTMNPDLIKVHFFTLYPGSVDYKKYKEENQLQVTPYHYLKPIVNLSDIELDQLKKLQRKFYRNFLFRPTFLFSHLYNYLPFYLRNFPGSFNLVFKGLLFLLVGSQAKNNKSG